MLESDKIYNWNDIVNSYPNMWAFITDIEEDDDGMIQSCRLLAICSYEKKENYVVQFMEQGIDFDCVRTTFSAPNMGVLC